MLKIGQSYTHRLVGRVVLECGVCVCINKPYVIVNVDWTQLDRAQTLAATAATDSRMCARIRPNRMKVATSLPMEEELAAIKRKKKVIV